jgi:hypothetical protein
MTSQYHPLEVDELKQLYNLRNEAQIVAFLDITPLLYIFLREIQPVIQNYFPDENLALEMTFDPEEEDAILFVVVETKMPVDKALTILNRFDEEWWLAQPSEIRSNIVVDVNFR